MPHLRVLTLCTGNVCRSPAAAVMLREALRGTDLEERVEVGSAGTTWEAEGEPMDDRTMLALERAGYTQPFEHTARTIHLTELLRWDLVLPMSIQHSELLQRMSRQAPEGSEVPEVSLWRRFEPGVPPGMELAVDDPWYDEQEAFDELILSMQKSVPPILEHLREMLAERASALGETQGG